MWDGKGFMPPRFHHRPEPFWGGEMREKRRRDRIEWQDSPAGRPAFGEQLVNNFYLRLFESVRRFKEAGVKEDGGWGCAQKRML